MKKPVGPCAGSDGLRCPADSPPDLIRQAAMSTGSQTTLSETPGAMKLSREIIAGHALICPVKGSAQRSGARSGDLAGRRQRQIGQQRERVRLRIGGQQHAKPPDEEALVSVIRVRKL